MDSIRIKNLRSLRDTGLVEMRPLVLLVGANSSGKSTFLRTFPLLKQSLDVMKKGPLLWFGPEVDFGSFKEAITSGEKKMCFEIVFSDSDMARKSARYRSVCLKRIYFEVTKHKKHDHVSCFSLDLIDNQNIKVIIDGEKVKIEINNRDFSPVLNNFDIRVFDSYGLLPNLFLVSRTEGGISNVISQAIETFVKEETGVEIDPTVLEKKRGIYISVQTKEEVLKTIKESFADELSKGVDRVVETIYDYLSLRDINEIIDSVNTYLRFKFGDVRYIKPIRASAERYYRVQNLSVNELDSDGHNLAMFLNDLYSDKKQKVKFQEWTNSNFGFIVDVKERNGQVTISIHDQKNDDFVNIADTGAGYAQILPIMIKMWQTMTQKSSRFFVGYGDASQSTIFAIEQPELHLHPNLQVKFADSLVALLRMNSAGNTHVKAIVETHSKDIIGRIGLCVERGQISQEDVIILLFDDDHTIRQAYFDKNGVLQDWPIGFFDPE